MKEAIHHRAVDYILKTEGDQATFAAVRKAVDELDREMEMDDQLAKARTQLQAALPILQNDFLHDVLHGDMQSNSKIQQQLDEMDIDLRTDAPILLAAGKIDEWPSPNASDKMLLLYAVQNIAEEYFAPGLKLHSVTYEKGKIAWLLQLAQYDPDVEIEEGLRRAVRFATGTAEQIQQTCHSLLKVKLSLAIAGEFRDWTDIPDGFERLQRALRRSFGPGKELLLIDDRGIPAASAVPVIEAQLKKIQKKIVRLEQHLESGQELEYRQALSELMSDEALLHEPELRLTAFYQLLSMTMTALSNEGILMTSLESTSLEVLLAQPFNASWEETIARFAEIGESIFRARERLDDQHGRMLIQRIKSYIEDNLSGDLSLTRIGEVVSLNPTYLSRLYKKLTGDGLSDTIMSARLLEAKRQLKETNDKVQEIASRVGFESPAYFNRFFKKAVDMTPQEYRDSTRK